MNKVIFILGDLACGKTTFAKQLSKRYNIMCFVKDYLKEILSDNIGFSDRASNIKLSKGALSVMIEIFKQASFTNSDIILEANFHEDDLKQLYNIAKEANYQTLTIKLTGNIPILYERYLKRIKLENRHITHQSWTVDSIKPFSDYILLSRNLSLQGNILAIDANNFSYQTDALILKEIDEFIYKN